MTCAYVRVPIGGVCLPVGVCLCASWCVSVDTWRTEMAVVLSPNLSTLMLDVRFSVNVSSWIWLGWLSTALQRSTCPHSLALVLQTYTDVSDFSTDAEDPSWPTNKQESRTKTRENVFVMWGILTLRLKCL